MQKLLSGLAAGAAFSLIASSALACDFHKSHVTASVPAEQTVVMSTFGDAHQQIVVEDNAAVATPCPEGATDCTPVEDK